MKHTILYIALAGTLSACTGSITDLVPDNRPDYKTSRVTNPLEVPPDLTQSSVDEGLMVSELSATDNASLADYQNERSGTSAQSQRLENALKNIQSNGDVSWIEIDVQPGDVFNNVKSFWLNNGLPLSRVDENIGIMETDWLEPKRNLPTSGISALLAKAISGLTDDGVRDKFRTRIDYDGERSYVYLTHYGATEEQVDDNGKITKSNAKSNRDNASANYTWFANQRNPELEVEMLRRINLYLQKTGKQAAATPNTAKKANQMQLSQLSDGTPVLVIDSNFNQAWMLLGVAIDRAGFDLGAQNRQQGTYSFAKITEKRVGFILKETVRDITNYTVGLADQGDKQVVVVRSVENKKPTATQARDILEKISKEIRF